MCLHNNTTTVTLICWQERNLAYQLKLGGIILEILIAFHFSRLSTSSNGKVWQRGCPSPQCRSPRQKALLFRREWCRTPRRDIHPSPRGSPINHFPLRQERWLLLLSSARKVLPFLDRMMPVQEIMWHMLNKEVIGRSSYRLAPMEGRRTEPFWH